MQPRSTSLYQPSVELWDAQLSREAVVRACRRTGQKAGRRPADHVAEATAVRCACMSHEISRATCLQCTTACCLCIASVIICGSWRACNLQNAAVTTDVHWGNVGPLHPSLVFNIHS